MYISQLFIEGMITDYASDKWHNHRINVTARKLNKIISDNRSKYKGKKIIPGGRIELKLMKTLKHYQSKLKK